MEKKNIIARIDMEIADNKERLSKVYAELVEYFAYNGELTVFEGIGTIEEKVMRLKGTLDKLSELSARRWMVELVYGTDSSNE